MIGTFVTFFLSAVIIVGAGIVLTKCADHIATITKLGRLLVGSVFLAAATSLPEFFVDLSAVRANMPNLAVGDLFGSSLFNLLILAVADLIHKGRGILFSRASAKHALSASMSISVTALAGIGILLASYLEKYSIAEVGVVSLVVVVAYVFGLRMIYFDQNSGSINSEVLQAEQNVPQRKKLLFAVSGYLMAAAVILGAAPFLAESAGEIADKTGLGRTFVGTTLVAFSTSLPEFASTLAAVRMGAYDLALGNIFGSNAFNMILLAPLDMFYKGSLLASVSVTHVFTCFATILITSVAVMGQLYQVEKRKRFLEPDAMLIILLVVGALAVLFFVKSPV